MGEGGFLKLGEFELEKRQPFVNALQDFGRYHGGAALDKFGNLWHGPRMGRFGLKNKHGFLGAPL